MNRPIDSRRWYGSDPAADPERLTPPNRSDDANPAANDDACSMPIASGSSAPTMALTKPGGKWSPGNFSRPAAAATSPTIGIGPRKGMSTSSRRQRSRNETRSTALPPWLSADSRSAGVGRTSTGCSDPIVDVHGPHAVGQRCRLDVELHVTHSDTIESRGGSPALHPPIEGTHRMTEQQLGVQRVPAFERGGVGYSYEMPLRDAAVFLRNRLSGPWWLGPSVVGSPTSTFHQHRIDAWAPSHTQQPPSPRAGRLVLEGRCGRHHHVPPGRLVCRRHHRPVSVVVAGRVVLNDVGRHGRDGVRHPAHAAPRAGGDPTQARRALASTTGSRRSPDRC